MNAFETIIYAKRETVAWISLNRPQVHNAIDLRMRDELWEAIQAAQQDPGVRVVVVRGEGASFSSGADINDFGASSSYIEARRARRERDLWGALAYFPKPLIAAIHGYVLGAGLELAMLCDIRVCAEDAELGLPEAKLGYIPAAGGTQLLPRLIGNGHALEIMLTGEPIEALEAYRLGLVHRVVQSVTIRAEAESYAKLLADKPPEALRLAKEAVLRGLDTPLDQGLVLEQRLARSALTGN